MNDFWISCGHHLLDRNASGGLVVTDEFLKAYFARPELIPPEDACEVEHRLHRELLAEPAPSGRSRTKLLRSPTRMRGRTGTSCWHFMTCCCDIPPWKPPISRWSVLGSKNLPPLFINQLVQAILRNVLDGCEDPFVLRAAELFFRQQRVMPA